MDNQAVRENRQSARLRKVRPVSLVTRDSGGVKAQKIVSANVSLGGMLLVTRDEQFPAEGSTVTIRPQTVPGLDLPGKAIEGRIVYIRYSPKAELNFAGLEFVDALDDEGAQAVGLKSGEGNVRKALKTLEELEGLCAPEPTESDAAPGDVESLTDAADGIRAELEQARTEFLKAAQSHLGDWIQDKASEAVQSHHALALAMGVEGLRNMKHELRGLISNLPSLVESELGVDDLWPHRAAPLAEEALDAGGAAYFDREDGRPSMEIKDNLARLLGFAGVILIKNGFEDLGRGADWVGVSGSGRQVIYRGRFAMSEAMTDTLRSAADLFDRLCKAERELRIASDTQARERARVLWEGI